MSVLQPADAVARHLARAGRLWGSLQCPPGGCFPPVDSLSDGPPHGAASTAACAVTHMLTISGGSIMHSGSCWPQGGSLDGPNCTRPGLLPADYTLWAHVPGQAQRSAKPQPGRAFATRLQMRFLAARAGSCTMVRIHGTQLLTSLLTSLQPGSCKRQGLHGPCLPLGHRSVLLDIDPSSWHQVTFSRPAT